MRCVMCKRGETKPGVTSVLLTRDDFTFVLRDVPADICEVCGEDYIKGEVAKDLYKLAERIRSQGTLLDVRRYHVNSDTLCSSIS